MRSGTDLQPLISLGRCRRDEIERLASAICGDDEDPALFAQAMAIAENELTLRRYP